MSNDKNILKRGLDEYFQAAKQEKSSLSAENINSILNKAVIVKPKWPKVVAITSAAVLLISFGFWLVKPVNYQITPAIKTAILKHALINKNNIPDQSKTVESTRSLNHSFDSIHSKSLTRQNSANRAVNIPNAPSIITPPTIPPAQNTTEPETEKAPPVKQTNEKYCINMQGIHLITLSEQELEKIHVIVANKNIFLIAKPISFGFGKFESGKFEAAVARPSGSKQIPYKAYDSLPFPALITDDLGNWQMFNSAKFSFEEIPQVANTLIPILVKSGSDYTEDDIKNNRRRRDLIFWYEPTDSLLDKLPQWLSVELRKDYNKVVGNETSTDSISGCTYFEACNNTLASFCDVNLYPNPVQSNFSLSIEIEGEERTVHIGLYDISGREVKALGNNIILNKGNNTLHFDADGLSKGMYLVEIIADNGQAAYQRLIKQ